MTTPSVVHTINPTVSRWTCDWSSLSDWETYNGNAYFIPGNVGSDATIGPYFNGPAGGSPSRRWDRSQPITARLRLKRFSAGWIGFSLFAGEAEYVGFSINSEGGVQYYCNAAYYIPANSYTATNGKAVELQIEFDGNQTYVFKVRDYDPLDQAAWTLIGTKTFLPKVHPTIQINHEGGIGKAWYGTVEVTGSEVWQTSDVADRPFWLPVATHYALEWGIEFELANATDRGVQHFLTHAGGHTIQAVTDRYNNGGTATWDQTNLSTIYSTGTFFYQSATINPVAGGGYDTLEMIGGLRSGGAGSSVSVSIRKSDGTLVPSVDIKGAANPVTFTSVLAEVKTVDLSDIGYTGIYLEIDGNSPNSTTHTSPTTTTNEGRTGPPIIKQMAVTFTPPPIAINTPSVSTSGSATLTGIRTTSGYTVEGVSGATFGAVSYPTSTTWSMPISGLTVGANSVTVRALNGAVEVGIATVNVRYELGLDFSVQPYVETVNESGVFISYGTFDHQAEDVESFFTNTISATSTLIQRETIVAIEPVTATLIDTAQRKDSLTVSSNAIANVTSTTQQNDQLNISVSSFATVADAYTANVSKPQFQFVVQPYIESVNGSNVTISYSTADTENDDLISFASSEASLLDNVQRIESLLLTAQFDSSIHDTTAKIEALTSQIEALCTITDVRVSGGIFDSVLTYSEALASVTDKQVHSESVENFADITSSISTILNYWEIATILVEAQVSMVEKWNGASTGSYEDIIVSMRDPLKLTIRMRDPLKLKISMN